MPLERLWCYANKVRDVSPLAGMKLNTLECDGVTDLTPLRGMPLAQFGDPCGVADIAPLLGMPLKSVRYCVDPKRDREILRSIKTLEEINRLPVAEFWKQVDAGHIPGPK
jgi:eukaryotic-like serine/threonine-protein kinase